MAWGVLAWKKARGERRARNAVEGINRDLLGQEWVLRQGCRIAGLGTCSYNLHTQTYACSDEWCSLFDLTLPAEGKLIADHFLAVVKPREWSFARVLFERIQRGEQGPPLMLHLVTKTRGERVVVIKHELARSPQSPRETGQVIVTALDITDPTGTTLVQRDGECRLEKLVRVIPGVLFQLLRNSSGEISVLFISDGAKDLFGREPQELMAQPEIFFRFFGKEAEAEMLRSLIISAESMHLWQHDVRIVRAKNEVWMRFSALPTRDLQNGTITWSGMAIDVTQTKTAEEALRESERRLRMTQFAVDHVKDAVAFLSPDGDRLYVNDETCRLTGYSREELLKAKIWSTFTSFTLDSYRQLWAYVQSRGTHVFEVELRTRTNEIRSVEVSVSFIGFDEQELVFAIARDITARKAVEQTLRENEERLRFTQFALDHARDIVSIIDHQGRRLYVNDTFCRFTGRDREESYRTQVWDTVPAFNQERFEALWEEIKRGHTLSLEIEMMTKSGELKPLEVNASYLNFGGREAVCMISRDLTARHAAEMEKKRMHQQLQETQKLESLGVLAGGIAHDFNNLLTGVLGNASLVRDRLSETSDLHEPLRQIERASIRAAELCQQMLAYAGKGRFIVEPLNLSALVEDTAKLLDLSIARRARLDLQLASALPAVLADATQLRQIVMNLVINAAEAMTHSRGVIRVVTGKLQIDRKFLTEARVAAELAEGEGVFLEVSDTGMGMDRKTLDRIFEPFFTTKFTGRGLGLAAVLGIVRSHQGALHVESEPGKGTTFKLVLAAHHRPAAPTQGTPPIFPSSRKNQGRILVVDDEESVRAVACQALERIGFTVETAADGESALARLRVDPQQFVVIVLDYTMPHLDGAQTLKEIRRINPEARVILMSGFPEVEARERLGDKGLAGFVQKPFDVGTLRKRVEEAIAAG